MDQQPNPPDVDAFLDSTLVGDDPALAAALAASDAAELPRIAVSAQQGKFLCLLAGAIQARRVLEIGTLGGFSTIWLARGAGPQGRVVTLEYQPKHAEVARVNLQRAGVADRVEVVVGPALDTLPTLAGGPFDLVFIDADKENNVAYIQWAIRLARRGAVIVVDNVIRGGGILAESDDADAVAARRTLQMMGEHPGLDATGDPDRRAQGLGRFRPRFGAVAAGPAPNFRCWHPENGRNLGADGWVAASPKVLLHNRKVAK